MIGAFTDHLWQSTVFVLAAAAVAAMLRQNGAHVRHRIWLIASMKFLVPLSVLVSLGGALPRITSAATPGAPATVPDLSIAVEQMTQPFTSGAFASAGTTAKAGTNWIPWLIAGIWAGGFVAVVGMRVRGWQRVRAALRTSVALPVTAPVPVRSSPGLLEPGVVGLWQPVLLVPQGIEHQLTVRQFEAVLLHEWCHVQRRDNLTSAIHMLVEAVFWFHPLVWFVGARLVDERERACDEFVLRTSNDPAAYAESILNVCRLYVESPVACVSGVTGAGLKKRVAAIMVNRIGLQLNPARKAALVSLAILAVALPVGAGMLIAPMRASTFAAAQNTAATADSAAKTAALKFDVASIKPCAPDAPPGPGRLGPGATSPGYLHLHCFTLRQLLNIASGNNDNRLNAHFRNRPEGGFDVVRGGPSWVASDRFTVEARAAGITDRKTLTGPPLLALLEDRFQLTFHRAVEDQPVYALTVAAGGLKLKPVTPGSCYELDRANMPAPGAVVPRQLCGELTSTAPFRVTGAKIGKPPRAMGFALSDFLSSIMDRIVVDKTGLDAHYDVAFDYTPNEATPGAIERLRRDAESGRPQTQPIVGPPIFKALQNLGLVLAPAKEPVEYLVIDRVEKLRPDLFGGPGQAPVMVDKKFDVASVKPCEESAPAAGARAGGGGQQASPGYLHLGCLTLRQLVLMAHAGPDNRLRYRKWEEQFVPGFLAFVRGGPSWAYSDTFTIEAKAEGVTNRDVLTGPMLRALLADRFQLKIHRDAEERSILTLTVAKTGLKIQPTTPGSCYERDPANPPQPGSMGDKAPCGLGAGNGWGSSEYFGVAFGNSGRDGERFTDHLWRVLRQPVIDRTGLDGRYSFKLEYTPDDTTPGVNGRCGGNPDCMATLASNGMTDTRPESFRGSDNFFKALERLGLKLEKAKAPAEFIVIDHAERPKADLPANGGSR